jgi:hypothetical protein
MKFKLEITQMDNDAFQDGNKESEIIAVLARAADLVESGFREASLLDSNGNRVGYFRLY